MHTAVPVLLLLLALVAFGQTHAASGCYGANVTSFYWCSGYEGAGYNCSGSGANQFCAIDTCVASCQQCAIYYPNDVVDAATGRCCDSLSGGTCVGQKDGNAPANPTYGWPDEKPSLIIEGCAPYTNGPTCWSDADKSAAYGFTANTVQGTFPKDSDCPPIPPSLGLDPTQVFPISFSKHNEPAINQCIIGCNITEVQRTGVDPCKKGSITSPVSVAMGCFWGGPGFLTPAGLGVCAYVCQVYNPNTNKFCNSTEVGAHECFISCDPRSWPHSRK